jgi:hypothetical protein
MMEDEDVLFRPVLRGILAPERLLDGSVDLQFVMLLNEAMIVEGENQRRVSSALRHAAETKTHRR